MNYGQMINCMDVIIAIYCPYVVNEYTGPGPVGCVDAFYLKPHDETYQHFSYKYLIYYVYFI